ncbi:ABC transporter substrate-binding protein [Rhizobium ruizarguesonis]|nr:ABC transporter substrate-binding protein [Rhizobium ruizarguesonis]
MISGRYSLAVWLLLIATPVKADVLVGVVGPFTGPDADFGAQLLKGAQLAADDINAAGGINGEKITIEFGNDCSDPKFALSVAYKFVADGAKFVVGNVGSFAGIPASDEYDDNGVLQISSTSTISSFTERGKWNAFRVAQNPIKSAVSVGKFLANKYSHQTVVVLHDEAKSSTEEAEKILKSALSSGMNSNLITSSAQISSVSAATAIVFYTGAISPNEITKNLYISSWTGELLMAGGPSLGSPDSRDLIAKAKSSDFDPDANFLRTYASLELLAAGLKKGGTSNPEAVAKALKNEGPFQTTIGDVSFDGDGDVVPQPESDILSFGVDNAGIREVCGSTSCPTECKGGCPNSSKCCGVASYGWK